MSEDKSICIFGASTIWGAYDGEKGGWGTRLQLYYNEELPEEEWAPVYVLGISSETTRGLLTRFNNEARVRDPQILIFSLSKNDAAWLPAKNSHEVPMEEFAQNVKAILKNAKSFTDKILILGDFPVDETRTTPAFWAPTYHYRNADIILYNEKMKEVATSEGVKVIELKDTITLEDLDDGLHPNARGHEKIFQLVRKEITKL